MIGSEWDLIGSLKKIIDREQAAPSGIKGIGDDCAVYKSAENRFGLFSADSLVDEVHFRRSYARPGDIGFRAMTANISDILAMGGKPVLALVCAGIPRDFSQSWIEELYMGMTSCANKYGTFIAGGDTTSSDRFFLSISIYGETEKPVYRNGAGIDEYIYVTGTPGLSAVGLEVLNGSAPASEYPLSVKKHLRPEPRSDLLESIIDRYCPTAMIDISDGLVSDLNHICESSGTGFTIEAERLPVHHEVRQYSERTGKDPVSCVLSSGEEYELLFTSEKKIENRDDFTLIGRITEGEKQILKGGAAEPAPETGYNHFRQENNE